MKQRKAQKSTRGTNKRSVSTIVLTAVFLLGIAILLYPTVSNYINQINATRAIINYDDTVERLTEAQKKEMLAAANEYNASLLAHPKPLVTGEPEDETYKSLLSVTDDGIMGHVAIKKIDVQLPIYHGSDDKVLATGVGHLEGSSLPVGGMGTHAVITGHRGLPAAKLFTDLDQMEVGDTFTVTVLGKTLTYQVDQIKIVLPEKTEDLVIDPERDYCTLLTCTPYSVNTHRLLVRGVHVDTPADVYVAPDAKRIDPVLVAPLVAAPVLLILLFLLLRRGRPHKRQRNVVSRAESRDSLGKRGR